MSYQDTRRIDQRVALLVKRPGAEDVTIDVDVGMDVTRLELALAILFGSESTRAERLWLQDAGGVHPVVPENPREHQPIGAMLNAGDLYQVTLAADQPPARGG